MAYYIYIRFINFYNIKEQNNEFLKQRSLICRDPGPVSSRSSVRNLRTGLDRSLYIIFWFFYR